MGIHSLMQNLTVKDAVPAKVDVGTLGRKQIIQNRFNHGPNLGSMFVAEKWIDDSIFPEGSKGDSELAAVEALVKQSSEDEVRKKFEDRWNNFMQEDDWKYLASKGVTAVRLPIGYWNVDAKFCKSTPFEKYTKVYEGAWDIIKKTIKAADAYDIGVLVDFHGVPGGANGDAHSGTNSGKAEFWGNSKYRDLALDMYKFAIDDLDKLENIVGIQIINEAPYGESKMKPFYLDAIKQIRKHNESIPIVISDGWDLGGWRDTIKQLDAEVSKKNHPATVGVIIDTHVYRMFSDDDKKRSADEHCNCAKDSVPRDDDTDVLVGEYSCVLSEESWGKSSGNRDDTEKEYGLRQNKCFESCTRAGAYFWTYKFMQGPGGGWDFRCMADKGAIPSYPREVDVNKPDVEQLLGNALNDHKGYWESQDKNQDWEFWRFEDGFKQGFEDAKKFAEFNASEVGRVAALKTARLAEHIDKKGYSDKVFGFAQAYVQALDAFRSSL